MSPKHYLKYQKIRTIAGTDCPCCCKWNPKKVKVLGRRLVRRVEKHALQSELLQASVD